MVGSTRDNMVIIQIKGVSKPKERNKWHVFFCAFAKSNEVSQLFRKIEMAEDFLALEGESDFFQQYSEMKLHLQQHHHHHAIMNHSHEPPYQHHQQWINSGLTHYQSAPVPSSQTCSWDFCHEFPSHPSSLETEWILARLISGNWDELLAAQNLDGFQQSPLPNEVTNRQTAAHGADEEFK